MGLLIGINMPGIGGSGSTVDTGDFILTEDGIPIATESKELLIQEANE